MAVMRKGQVWFVGWLLAVGVESLLAVGIILGYLLKRTARSVLAEGYTYKYGGVLLYTRPDWVDCLALGLVILLGIINRVFRIPEKKPKLSLAIRMVMAGGFGAFSLWNVVSIVPYVGCHGQAP